MAGPIPTPEAKFPEGGPGDPRTPLGGGSRWSRILGGDTSGRNVWIAVLSTLVFFTLVAVLIVRSPGWVEVKRSFFDGAEFRYSLPKIADKFLRNVAIFCIAEVLVLALALLIAVLRSLPGPVFTPIRILAAAYTD